MKKIICFGDSITQGISWFDGQRKTEEVKESYPALLASYFPDLEFINKGVHKNTSKQALERFDQDVIAVKPDFLMVLLGSNDANINWMRFVIDNFRNPQPMVSLDEFRKNLSIFIDKAKANNIVPMLSNLTPIALDVMLSRLLKLYGNKFKAYFDEINGLDIMLKWHGSYSDAIESICKEKNVAFVNLRKEFLGQPNWQHLLSIDGIHPLPSGYKVMADFFYRSLKDILK